jgi:hypothetical protein
MLQSPVRQGAEDRMPKDKKQSAARKITWNTVRELALALPDTEESTSYRTPAIKFRGKMFVRLKEDGETIVVTITLSDRAMRLEADPDVFFVTEHYRPFPYVLVRLSVVTKRDLKELLADAWKLVAR